MLTTLNGHETKTDLRIIEVLEKRFGKPLVFFRAIQQPSTESDGYWHVRVKSVPGITFVRQNGVGEVFLYGPSKGELLEDDE